MERRSVYFVRFVTPEGPENYFAKLTPDEFERLKERLSAHFEGGDLTDPEIVMVDQSISLALDQINRNLDARFGAIEKGRPDVSRVDERLDPETEKIVRDLLVTAFEGGSNYWYRIESKTFPPGSKLADFKEGGRMQPPGEYYHWSQLIPTFPGGSLTIRDIGEGEGETHILDLPALKKGWILLKQKFPKRYERIKAEDYDAEDGDAFLQLSLFGDVIFG